MTFLFLIGEKKEVTEEIEAPSAQQARTKMLKKYNYEIKFTQKPYKK